MDVTQEQRTWARVAGITILLKTVLELGGDTVTIISRTGASFEDTAHWAAQSDVLYRFALLNVGVAWIVLGIMAFALYVVLEPVNKRLAQLALILRLGASFVGAASLMFRFAQGWLYKASEPAGLFTTEQLHALVNVSQRAAGAGVTTAWIFLSAGWILFNVLLLRSRYLPRALAGFSIFASSVFMVTAATMFVLPQLTNTLKLLGLPGLVAEIATALWLLFKGLPPRATTEGVRA